MGDIRLLKAKCCDNTHTLPRTRHLYLKIQTYGVVTKTMCAYFEFGTFVNLGGSF